MKKLLLVLAVVATLLAACAAPTPQIVVVTATQPPATARPTVRPTARPTARPKPLVLSDLTLTLIVIETQCFGSAGGLVTVQPELGVDAYAHVGQEYLLIYEIRGGEYGAETDSLEMHTNGTYSYTTERTISTTSCDDKLSVQMTGLYPQ